MLESTIRNIYNQATSDRFMDMPDFTEHLRPASPTGPETLAHERGQSDVSVDELAQHLLRRDGFLERQQRILPILEKDRLFSKARQQNLSRPERYHLGLARAKKIRRYQDQYGWDQEDYRMAAYLCDDVSPMMVHDSMFPVTIREQASEEQSKYWMPKIEKWEAIGCYAQ